MNANQKQLQDMLLQSLYDYHFANNGASYTLPKAMLNLEESSKVAIDFLLENGYAEDNGGGTDNLVLSITEKGMEYIRNKS